MPGNRIGRINEEILRELSYLLPKLKDPRIQGMVSILRVDTTADLRYSKVYISVLGSESQQKSTGKALKSASGFLRRELGKALRLRYTPELIFEINHSLETGSHIISLINEVQPKQSDSADIESSLDEDGSIS